MPEFARSSSAVAATLETAMRRPLTSVQTPPVTIRALLDQIEALHAQVAELANLVSAAEDHTGAARGSAIDTHALTRAVIRARRERLRYLPRALFSEPAWDLLLALFSAELAQHRVSVTKLCAAADLPATTALRWLTTLESYNLVVRHADPLDGRRSFVALTERGERAMQDFFQNIKGSVLAV